MSRVLLIEPDESCARAVELGLASEGFQVFTTDLGEEGVDLAKVHSFDAVLVCDPEDITAYAVLRQIRAAKLPTPVVLLSSFAETKVKVAALHAGADDYIAKPVHKDELCARLTAVIRRMNGHAQSVVKVGNLTVDLSQRRARVAGKVAPLTPREYQLLELLTVRKGVVITRTLMMDHLYAGMDEPELKIIDVFVCKVRRKLREAGCDVEIQNVWGRGYMLVGPAAEAAEAA